MLLAYVYENNFLFYQKQNLFQNSDYKIIKNNFTLKIKTNKAMKRIISLMF